MYMDAVDEIKSRINVEDVVAEYVQLKRAGRNFKGLSPFQAEKSPSFVVSPEKGIWHDFSSNKGGNMFSFVMEMEGVDFRGAMEILARKAGVDLETYGKPRSNTKFKERLSEALELATQYFYQNLKPNPDSIAYLRGKRGFTLESIKEFRLGYSPMVDDGLTNLLKKRGFTEDELIKAGLSTMRYKGLSDMFRGRIMVTLMDQMGNVIGFTARQLVNDPNSPKYFNTPQTLLYDKGRHVYALSQAKDAIRTSKFAVIVEGNLDVVSSHQAGIRQCVATAGTAMTEHHLKALSKFTSDIRLCFDGDAAGLNATERAIEIAQGLDIKLSVIDVVGAKDPDELIQQDPALWHEAVARPTYAMDWLFARCKTFYDTTSASGKKQYSGHLMRAIRRLTDDVEREHYLDQLAIATDVSPAAIRSKFAQKDTFEDTPRLKTKRTPPLEAGDEPVVEAKQENIAYQDQLLGLLLMHPITRRVFETLDVDLVFASPERQYVFEFIASNPHATLTDVLPGDLQSVADYVNIALLKAEELYQRLDANERLIEANDLVRRLQKDHKKQKQSELTISIKLAEDSGDDDRVLELLGKFNDLVKE
jgi:DNA primase